MPWGAEGAGAEEAAGKEAGAVAAGGEAKGGVPVEEEAKAEVAGGDEETAGGGGERQGEGGKEGGPDEVTAGEVRRRELGVCPRLGPRRRPLGAPTGSHEGPNGAP